MSKVTRIRLARGAKLMLGHAYTHLSTIATKLSNKAIAADNIADNFAPFRVNLCLPCASFAHLWETDPTWVGTPDAPRHTRHFSIPVPLLPPQDVINQAGIIAEGDPVIMLDEVMLSFEQGGEGGMYVDPGASNLGDPDRNIPRMEIKLSVLAKTPLWIQADAGTDPDEELFSAKMPLEAFIGSIRLNPNAWPDLSRQVNPYKTLLVVLEADELGEVYGGTNFALPNLVVSLRFRHQLTPHGTQIQNQSGGTNSVADTVTVAVPATDTPIAADGASGLQTGLNTLDTALGRRLLGGFQEDGWRPRVTHVADDSVYDVIAVPMYSNFSKDGVLTPASVVGHPWFTEGVAARNVWDERLIPISWPFEVHHVIACLNYGAPNGLTWMKTAGLSLNQRGVRPTSVTYQHSIDVAIGSYVRHDHMAWQTIASDVLTQASLLTQTFDRIRVNESQTMTDETFQHELAVIPLVGAAATGRTVRNLAGTNLQQGAPVFVARGSTRSYARSSVGGATAPTRGCEQILRVAWKIEDTAADLNAATANHIFAGVGGNWVFILGRKSAVGEDFTMRM